MSELLPPREAPREYYEGQVIGANTRLLGLVSIAAQEGLSQFQRQDAADFDQRFDTPPSFDALLSHYVIGHTLVPVKSRINASGLEGTNKENLSSIIRELQESGIRIVERYIDETEEITPLQKGSCNAFLAVANAFSWSEHHEMFKRLHASTSAVHRAHMVLAAETIPLRSKPQE